MLNKMTHGDAVDRFHEGYEILENLIKKASMEKFERDPYQNCFRNSNTDAVAASDRLSWDTDYLSIELII